MFYSQEEATKKFDRAIFWGGVWVGEGADIGARAIIGEGADIREGADIVSVCAKYTGNIVPLKTGIQIRIGCETHAIDSWLAHGVTLAAKHNEAEWWETTGKRMLDYLITEANLYIAEHKISEG